MDDQHEQGSAKAKGEAAPPAGLLAKRYRISLDGRGRLAQDRAVAADKESGERVFLKWSVDADMITREAAILQALDHPGIVRLKNSEIGTGGGLLVLELIDGVDLEAWLGTVGRNATGQELDHLFTALADAVAAVHAAGFIHRDLKPANILVQKDGSPVIVDFGAAAALDDVQGAHSLLTDGYAAPEQYRGDLAEGTWTDVYGLAAVAFRAVDGRPPPAAPSRERGEALAQALQHAPAGNGRLRQAIDVGLALDPDKRPRTASAWRDFLVNGGRALATQDPSTDALDDYPPTIKVERRPAEGHRVRTARKQVEAPPVRHSSSGWRWLGWLTVFGLAALAAFWSGRPYYERYVKAEWLVDAGGGGDVVSIGEALLRARDGAVLKIQAGSYRESLEILRPVHLIAADADAPPEIVADDAPCLRTHGFGSSVSGLVFRAVESAQPCLVVEGGDLAIEASRIESLSGPAVVIAGGARAEITGSRIVGGEGFSVFVRGGAEPRIEDNDIEGGDGVLFVEGAGGIFSDNRITGSRHSALRVALGADPVIKDNGIEAAGEAGIFVYDGGKGSFEGNVIEASTHSGVIIGDGADARLSANRIEASAEHGVLVLDGGRAHLDGNMVIGNGGYGFALAWEAEVELGANELGGNKIPDLFDARLPRASKAAGPISAPPGTLETSP